MVSQLNSALQHVVVLPPGSAGVECVGEHRQAVGRAVLTQAASLEEISSSMLELNDQAQP